MTGVFKKVFSLFKGKKIRFFPVFAFFLILFSFIRCGENLEFNYEYLLGQSSVTFGTRDILFVVDNSCSMRVEQEKMASAFDEFIEPLENESLDWRIAIATTDVEKNPGQLLAFENGEFFLTPQTPGFSDLFKKNIQREETPETCLGDSQRPSDGKRLSDNERPSNDERAVFAANWVLKNNPFGFLRPNTHFAIVIVSDEDERSGFYKLRNHYLDGMENGPEKTSFINFVSKLKRQPEENPEYRKDILSRSELETDDLPETLIQNVKSILGSRSTLSVHSVIIIPGDLGCLEIQRSQIKTKLPKALSYGHLYADLSHPDSDLLSHGHIVRGSIGSICASNHLRDVGDDLENLDYGSILSEIGRVLVEANFNIPCRLEDIVELEVTYQGEKLEEGENADYHLTEGDKNTLLTFSSNFNVGSRANVNYKCR